MIYIEIGKTESKKTFKWPEGYEESVIGYIQVKWV